MPPGDHKPCSTTLLAFFWHAGALWAIPDLPRLNLDSRKIAKLVAAGYQLLRLSLDTLQWQRVACQVGWALEQLPYTPLQRWV
jgi:hypothetical protein